MKNLFWIVQSVIIVVVYGCFLHFIFTLLSTWKSVAIVPIGLIIGFSCVGLLISLVAYIIRNYNYFECDLFD